MISNVSSDKTVESETFIVKEVQISQNRHICQFDGNILSLSIFVVACISGHKCKNNENNIKGATLANTTNH